ncbi:MAG: beta-lactamase family protein [bacterium]|nr:beta-lactamase family protein [bacterium]
MTFLKNFNKGCCLILLLVLVLIFTSSIAQVTEKQLIDFLEQVRNETGAPGISIAVSFEGKIIFSLGVGYADLDNMVPATGRTVHNIASVSKTIGVVALMKLVEEGKVDIDKEIQEYVPYFPMKEHKITVRHILTHSSGIRHYRRGEFGPDGLLEKKHYDKFEDAINHFKDDPLLYKPGESWLYSSHACNLMHGVVETVTGMGFEEYCRKYIWEPAGMLSTQFDVPERIVHKRGRGYVRDRRGRLMNVPYADVSYKYAGGGIISTVENLVRFGHALNDGTLLMPETIQEMYEVQIDPVMRFNPNGDSVKQSFKQALIWRVEEDVQGRRMISHSGTVKGTRSFLLNYPDEDLVVALQANSLPFDSGKYTKAIAQMFMPPVNPGIRK